MAATHIARTASRRLASGLCQPTTRPTKTTTTTMPAIVTRLFQTQTRKTAYPAPTRPTASKTASSSVAPPPPSVIDTIPPPAGEPLPDAASLVSPPPTLGEQIAPSPTAPPAPPIDWSASFHGLSTAPFAPDVAAKLMAPLDADDVEIKPDGILYLPEIKYRRILNGAFGPGGWGLAPRGELKVGEKVVSREYALVVQGRYVGQSRGECGYFGDDGVATAGEGCKSNALMRCCKDLGVASELWDPRFIRQFKTQYCREVWVEHVSTKKRRQIWVRKDCAPTYPYVLTSTVKR